MPSFLSLPSIGLPLKENLHIMSAGRVASLENKVYKHFRPIHRSRNEVTTIMGNVTQSVYSNISLG